MTGYEESENIVVGVSTDLAEKLELHLQLRLRVLPQEAARRVRVAHAGALPADGALQAGGRGALAVQAL